MVVIAVMMYGYVISFVCPYAAHPSCAEVLCCCSEIPSMFDSDSGLLLSRTLLTMSGVFSCGVNVLWFVITNFVEDTRRIRIEEYALG